jgi:hypothetical protein
MSLMIRDFCYYLLPNMQLPLFGIVVEQVYDIGRVFPEEGSAA